MQDSQLLLQDLFECLGIIDPLEYTEHLLDGYDLEPPNLKFLLGTFPVVPEHLVDYVEEFLDPLVQPDILPPLDQKHVLLLVGAVESDSLGPPLGIESQHGLLKGLYEHPIPG